MQPDIFGTDPEKLYRPEDPETSKEAARSVDTTALERLVYEVIHSFGPNGCISDEVRRHPAVFGKSYSSVTARYKALKDKKMIVLTGERRKGDSTRNQSVMRATTPDEMIDLLNKPDCAPRV